MNLSNFEIIEATNNVKIQLIKQDLEKKFQFDFTTKYNDRERFVLWVQNIDLEDVLTLSMLMFWSGYYTRKHEL